MKGIVRQRVTYNECYMIFRSSLKFLQLTLIGNLPYKASYILRVKTMFYEGSLKFKKRKKCEGENALMELQANGFG